MIILNQSFSLNGSVCVALYVVQVSDDKPVYDCSRCCWTVILLSCDSLRQIVLGADVFVIDLGRLIRKPSDKLLTPRSGSINPFPNTPLLFTSVGYILPCAAQRRGTVPQKYIYLPDNSSLKPSNMTLKHCQYSKLCFH